tara:strand:+ start:892 stop:1260 length:369 start_codon:yes stop_codon:yes gene_type:complete
MTKQQFPKMVYKSSDPADYVIIKTQEEWPEGAKAHWEGFEEGGDDVTEEDAKAAKADEKTAKAAKAATAAAKKAQKEHRQSIYDYLDEHDVEYAKTMSTERLEATKLALDQHLEGKKDDAQQ